MTDINTNAATAALVALAEHGIPPDTQELLVLGNPTIGIRRGALSAAIKAALESYLRDSGLRESA